MRAARFLVLSAGAALGVVAEWTLYGWADPGHWVPDLAAGWSLVACGVVAWWRRPQSRAGVLMAATGLIWFAGNFTTAGGAWLPWLSEHALYLYRGPLVHLVLTYPRGRAVGRLERAAVTAGYVAAVVTPVWRSESATIALSVALVAIASGEYLRSVGHGRPMRLAALQATALVGAVLTAGAALRLGVATEGAGRATLLGLQLALCVLAIAALVGLLEAPWERGRVTDLVVELGEARSDTLRASLARTLGDPSLQVGYWSPAASAYMDEAGRQIELSPPTGRRSTTRIDREGGPAAVLVHDAAVLADPRLLDAVATATRLAASNADLQAKVRAQVGELQASRRRLLRSRDAERRRLEQRLREGAEQRLLHLEGQLAGARSLTAPGSGTATAVARAEDQLGQALGELRELARGLHPRVLAESGLAGAIASLAERCPVPVALRLSAARLPEDVEAAVYFACSEVLANVAKYSSATSVTLSCEVADGAVRLEIADDGVGGADPARGSGLRGLSDRIDALGGRLRIASPPGGGTRIDAEIPLA